jgi:hypothetical protein
MCMCGGERERERERERMIDPSWSLPSGNQYLGTQKYVKRACACACACACVCVCVYLKAAGHIWVDESKVSFVC